MLLMLCDPLGHYLVTKGVGHEEGVAMGQRERVAVGARGPRAAESALGPRALVSSYG